MTFLDWFSRLALAAFFALVVLYAIGTKVDIVIGVVLLVVGFVGLVLVEARGS